MRTPNIVAITFFVLASIKFSVTFSALYRGVSPERLFEVPGTFQVQTRDAGRYYLWDNYRTMFNGTKISRTKQLPSGLEIVIRRDADGESIEFSRDTSEGWSIGNRAKSSVGYIESETAGEFEVEVRGDSETRVFSFSKADVGKELQQTLGGFGAAVVLGLIGSISAVCGLLTRRRRTANTVVSS